MKNGIFSIYDTKLQAYLAPFTAANNQVAIREFSQYANREGSPFQKHPADYQLIRVGDWDDDSGLPTPQDHVNLGFASEYIQNDAHST